MNKFEQVHVGSGGWGDPKLNRSIFPAVSGKGWGGPK